MFQPWTWWFRIESSHETSEIKYMNCSDALLEGVAKYALEIGLNPLKKAWVSFTSAERPLWQWSSSLIDLCLLLLAEFVLVVEQLEGVEDGLHGD